MIRYVLAVILVIALLALSVPALEQVAATNTDRHATAAITDLADAAVTLSDEEELPPSGHPSPQRVVTLTLPPDSATSYPLTHLTLEATENDTTIARYQFRDRPPRTQVLEVSIVTTAPNATDPFVVRGTGERTVLLTLETDDSGDPVVVARQV